MPQVGTFSGGGLGFGAFFNLSHNAIQSASEIERSLGRVSGATNAASAKISSGIQKVTSGFSMMAAGAAIGLPLAFGVKASITFDKQMSAVGATARATAEELQRLRANAIEMGEGTAFSARQAAEAQEFLALAGFNTEQIIKTMPSLLSAAAATTTDLSTTTTIVAGTMKAMGLASKDSAMLVDTLALTTVTATTDMIQMGEALKFAATSVAGIGGNTQELSALIGMLGDVNVTGTLAGTAIQNFILEMEKFSSSPKKLDALKSIGLSMSDVVDAEGNFRKLTHLIPTFKNALGNVQGNEAQGRIMTTLFGVRGARVMKAVLRNNEKDFAEYVDFLANSAGAAERIAKEKLSNLAGDLTISGSVIETTLIKIGAALTPILRPIVQGFTFLVTIIGKLVATPIGKFFIFATAALSAFLIVLGLVNVMSGALSFAVGTLTKAMLRFGLQSVATAFATGGLSAGFSALATAVWAALIPLLPFIAAGAAVAAAGWAMWKAITVSNDAFENFLSGKEEKATGVRLAFQRIGGVIKAGLAIWNSFNTETGEFRLSKTMLDALDELGIKKFVLGVAPFITKLKTIVSQVVKVFVDLWDTVSKAAGAIGGKLADKINWAEVAGWSLLGVVGLIVAALATAAVSVLIVFAPIIAMFVGVGLAIAGIIKLIGTVREKWDDWAASAKDFGKNLITSIKDGMASAWSSLVTWLQTKMNELPILGSLFSSDGDDQGTIAQGGNGTSSSAGLLDSTAELSALRVQAPQPVVVSNQNTVVKEISLVTQIDSEEISKKVIDIQNNEFSRSVDE